MQAVRDDVCMPGDGQKSDDLELDLKRYELRRRGRALRMEKIPMELFIFLVENKDKLVSRGAIVERLWGKDVFVDTEQGINTAIRKIRLVLRDDSEEPRFVQTVVGKGYRLVGPVTVVGGNETTTSEEVARNAAPTTPPASSQQSSRSRIVGVPVAILAIAVTIMLGINFFGLRHSSQSRNLGIHSIAVLPLENLSGDPGQEYLADGMTDELITHLAKLGSPKVISRTSVTQYKRARQPLPEIARALNVDAIVEGSIALSGNKVRVTVQLIRASDDQHLWAEEYDRELGDVIELQRQIAGVIAQQVAVNLGPEQEAYFAHRQPRDPALSEAYLRGLFFWDKRTEPDLHRAIDNFNAAVAREPSFAPAYAGLANSYNLLWYLGFMKAEEAVPQARAAMEKALALDPLSAEAHVARAYLLHHADWNWTAAEAEHLRAVELSPGYSLAHQWNAYFLRSAGRLEQALAENELARELDPLSVMKTLLVATALARRGDDTAALPLIRRAMELDPSSGQAHYDLSELLQRQGRAAESASEWRNGLQLDGDSQLLARFDTTLHHADLTAAKRAVAHMLVERRHEQAKHHCVSPRVFAELYMQSGDKESGLRWLEKAFDEHSSFLVQITHDPLYDPLRSEPRFQAMLRRMNAPGAK